MLRICQLVFVFVVALNQVCSNAQQKLYITVYYESLCPDSREFIIEQLEPTFSLLHNYLTLKLVPFGKAKSINNGHNGFKCQHGPSECYGNLVQSCTLDFMQKRSDLEKISYVACEMITEAGAGGDMKCIMRAGVPAEAISECVNFGKGTELQLRDEYFTKTVNPRFVPTITINSVFDQRVQDAALLNLKRTVCSQLRNVPQCAGN